MAKRSKSTSSHTSLRFPPDVAETLDTVATAAGWSVARAVSHLVRLGLAASKHQQKAVDELVAQYLGAIRLHAVELENAERLAAVRKTLRNTPARNAAASLVKAGRAKRRPKGLPPVPASKPDAAA